MKVIKDFDDKKSSQKKIKKIRREIK